MRETLAAALADVPAACRLVACSGGLDSMTLLASLVRLHRSRGLPPPRALHVHHGLQREADAWAAFVAEACARWDVPLRSERVRVTATGGGPEADARAARHRCFEAVLGPGEHLLCAHHRDDQVETVLLRLLRGAGPAGLAGMAPRRRLGAGWLTRPLLELDRAQLAAAAEELGLAWIDDPTNADAGFDRNHLRHRVLPALAERWPGYRETVARAARNCADQERLLGASVPAGPLPVAALLGDPAAARTRLRRWLVDAGLAVPSRRRLDELLRQARARPDAMPAVAVGACEVRRFADALHLVPARRPAPPAEPRAVPGPGLLTLPHGTLRVTETRGAGVAPACGPLELRFRSAVGGALRARPLGRGGSAPLKRLLQEARIPPWERDRLPLLFAGDALAAVPGLWVCEGFAASADAPGWTLHWAPADGAPEAPSSDAGRVRIERMQGRC
ncbi:MAG: tRNA lysidine(34) synthetase TilS [Pseudomonadales bacterium]|nr:tRNA lysidine(34) synthetase TilS [Pseudomonadales bacterium]